MIGTALAAKAKRIGIVTGDRPLLSVAECECVRIIGVSDAVREIITG